MRIKRLNESNIDFYYEIRWVKYSGEWMLIDPWEENDSLFDDFDWDSVDSYKDLELYCAFLKYLIRNGDTSYKLYKVVIEEIPQDKIDMILTTRKYNL